MRLDAGGQNEEEPARSLDVGAKRSDAEALCSEVEDKSSVVGYLREEIVPPSLACEAAAGADRLGRRGAKGVIMHCISRVVLATALLLGITGFGEAQPLRFGVLSDVDSLPYLVADEEGLYSKAGVEVKLVRFQSPVERDAAFQAGTVDGVIGDVLGAALAVDHGFPVVIVAATDGRYLLLASPSSPAKTPADLAGVPIGGSTNTVIHYMVWRFLTDAGVTPADVKVLAVPKMPVRLEMLLGGQLAAASLPEPLATVALARGARLLADSDHLGADPGVILFNKTFAETHRSAVAGVLKAGALAGAAINADNDRYRDFLVKKAGFPEAVRNTFRFVTYWPPRLPSDAAITAIVGWMQSQGLVKTALPVEALVDRRVLAEVK